MATSKRRAVKKAKRATKAADSLSMDDIKKYSAAVVGFMRGLVLAAINAAIGAAVIALQGGKTGKALGVAIAMGAGTAALRFVEGLIDKAQGTPPVPSMLGLRK